MLELLTTNEAQTGWIDLVPGQVSTGYQAQNAAIEAGWRGRDSSFLLVDTANQVTLKRSGIIDDFGQPFIAKQDYKIGIPRSNGTYLLYLAPVSGNPLQREVKASAANPVWLPAENCYVITEGTRQCRVLNWVVTRRSSGLSAIRLNQYNQAQTEWIFFELGVWRCPLSGTYLMQLVSSAGGGGGGAMGTVIKIRESMTVIDPTLAADGNVSNSNFGNISDSSSSTKGKNFVCYGSKGGAFGFNEQYLREMLADRVTAPQVRKLKSYEHLLGAGNGGIMKGHVRTMPISVGAQFRVTVGPPKPGGNGSVNGEGGIGLGAYGGAKGAYGPNNVPYNGGRGRFGKTTRPGPGYVRATYSFGGGGGGAGACWGWVGPGQSGYVHIKYLGI